MKHEILNLTALVACAVLLLSPAAGQVFVGEGFGKGEQVVAVRPRANKIANKIALAPNEDSEKELLDDSVAIIAWEEKPTVDPWAGKPRIIASGQKGWRFFDHKDGPPKDWKKPDFDDSKWQQGQAPLGYDDNSKDFIKTVLKVGDDPDNKTPAAYFRLKFKAQKLKSGNVWAMRAMVDDGGVVYLNGKEVQRIRMPDGEIKHGTRSSVKIGNKSELEYKFVDFEIEPKALKEGENVLCISVHQTDASSSDLTLDAELMQLSRKEFAAILLNNEKAQIAAAALAPPPPQPAAIRVIQPASILRTFDNRIQPELTRTKQMLRSLPRVIGINDDQVEELVIASDEAFDRLRASVEQRAQDSDQRKQSLLRNEIYQNKLSILKEKGLVETFAAILTPKQLEEYIAFATEREDARLNKTVEMFYANLDCGLFMTAEQKPKMLKFIKKVALDPANQRTYYSNNPINQYYRIQNGFNNLLRQNQYAPLEEILDEEQMDALKSGMSTGAVFGSGFIKVEDVLTPKEK